MDANIHLFYIYINFSRTDVVLSSLSLGKIQDVGIIIGMGTPFAVLVVGPVHSKAPVFFFSGSILD